MTINLSNIGSLSGVDAGVDDMRITVFQGNYQSTRSTQTVLNFSSSFSQRVENGAELAGSLYIVRVEIDANNNGSYTDVGIDYVLTEDKEAPVDGDTSISLYATDFQRR